MSFTSCSAKARARKTYEFTGAYECFYDAGEEMKSDRFERKNPVRKPRAVTIDLTIADGRGNEDAGRSVDPVMLGSINTNSIRRFYNLESYPYEFQKDADVIQWLCAIVSESPTGRMLLREAQNEGWSASLEDLSQTGYVIYEEARKLVLDHSGFSAHALGRSAHFRNFLLTSFIKALRQIWHDNKNLASETTYCPDASMLLERARAADCEVIAILVGWELRAAGHNDIWRYILGSEEGDMAMIFTRALEKDPAGYYDGSVFTRTFCQWYNDEGRIAASDHACLERLDKYLKSFQGADAFGKAPLKAKDIEKLSHLPDGRNYLSGMGKNIATDPYFVSINDPVNESHLFQIVYDSKAYIVEGVPFRDPLLARLIFPNGLVNVRE